MNGQSEKERAEQCVNCYFCQAGVDKTISLDILKKQRAEKCRQCYFCESGVNPSQSVDDLNDGISGEPSTSEAECAKCYTCESCVEGENTAGGCVNCFSCEWCVTSEGGKGAAPDGRRSEVNDKCVNCYSCEKCVTAQGGAGGRPMSGRERAAKCQNCYHCEQGVDKTQTVDMIRRNPYMQDFTYFLFPTNGCNLRCKYCYANNKPGTMTKETMENVLEFLFKKQKFKNVTCHFFGGEPMTRWNMVQDMVTIGNSMAKENGINVRWGMTTNGTLLNKERLEWIRDNFRKNNPFLLSIDGRPETHDRNRVYPGDKPSHKDIPVDLILEMFPYLECRPTILPDTAKDWFEDFKYLRNKGFKSIAVEPDFECEWSEEQMRDYEHMLTQLGHYYVLKHQSGDPMRLKFIDTVIQGLNNPGVPGGTMCGVAMNCAGIDHRGLLYACQRYASYNDPEKYSLGDVVNGWDEYKLMETQKLLRAHVQGVIAEGYNCNTCWVRKFCYKGCNAANRKWMGSREVALPMYCELSRIEVKVALRVLAELGWLKFDKGVTQATGCQDGVCPLPKQR